MNASLVTLWLLTAAARPVSLEEALALASQQSPDIAAARAEAAAATARATRATGAWLPELIAQGSFDYTNAPATLDLGGFVGLVGAVYGIPPVNAGAVPPPVTIVANRSLYGTLQLTQPLFSPQGAFLLGPARAGAEAAQLGAEEARQQVLLAVARTYLGLVGVAQMMDAAQAAEAVALRREKDARAQLQVGMAVEVSLLRAQTETAQARSTLAQLKGQEVALTSMLEALVGEPVTPRADAPTQAVALEAAAVVEESSEPWLNAFLVRSARKQVEALEGTVRYDRFAWLPSLVGIAKGNYNSNAGFIGQNTSYNLMVAVSVPLFDRGLRYATLREDEARLAQAQAAQQAAVAKARAGWLAAKANLQAAQSSLAQAEAQAQLAGRAQKQVESAFKAGATTSLELSDVDNKRFLAESSAASARAQVAIRRAELAAAAGMLGSAP